MSLSYEDTKIVAEVKQTLNKHRAENIRAKMDPQLYIEQLGKLFLEADAVNDMLELQKLKFKADQLHLLLKKCLPDLQTIKIEEAPAKDVKKTKYTLEIVEPSK